MLTTNKAIVLTTSRYGERRLLISMFTRECGMMSFAYAMPRQHGQPFRANCFQPLTVLDLEYDHRRADEVHRLTDVRLASPALSIPFDEYKLSISLFLAEFLRFALRHEQQNEPLFDYIATSIRWLDNAHDGYANFHIVFMVKLSKLLGIEPNIDTYAPEAWFDLNESTFALTPAPHAQAVCPAEAALIPTLLRLSFTTMHRLRLSHQERNYITQMILEYYSLHLPAFPHLRSFDIVKELFT